MRIVILALLFQFVSPIFTTVAPGTDLNKNDYGTLQAHHSAVVVPFLLKEKDENETNDVDLNIDFTSLIGFTYHSSILSKSHEGKFSSFAFRDRIDHHPPLFTLYRVFLI